MEDELLAEVRGAVNAWFKAKDECKELERAAEQHSSIVARMAKRWVHDEMYTTLPRDLYNGFGTGVVLDESQDYVEAFCFLSPERVPEDFREFHQKLVIKLNRLIHGYEREAGADEDFPNPCPRKLITWAGKFWNLALRAVLVVNTASVMYEAEQNSEDPDRAVCNAYLRALRAWGPTLLAVHMQLAVSMGRGHEAIKQEVTAGLAGWIRTEVKKEWLKYREEDLLSDPSLAYSEDDLLRELPVATLVAWSEREPGENLFDLRNRIANHLKKFRDESKRLLEHAENLAEPETDPALEDFELRETMRQQLDALEQTAGLSPREMQVWRRHRRGMEAAEIAAELETTANNVYATKFNAIKKLVEARQAAGF